MTREDGLERRLADWLEEGPLDAPDGPVAAALAHARDHPRRRLSLHGLWGAFMSQMNLTEIRPSDPQRRGVLAAVAAVAVVAIIIVAAIGSGALSTRPPSEPAAPAVVPATPAPATPVPTRPGASVTSDIAGSWSGDVVGNDTTTWATTLTLHACAQGEVCGSLEKSTGSVAGSGVRSSCTSTLVFTGPEKGSTWYVFDETTDGAPGCVAARLYVTPSLDLKAASIEEIATGLTVGQGTLWARSAPAPAATPTAQSSMPTPAPSVAWVAGDGERCRAESAEVVSGFLALAGLNKDGVKDAASDKVATTRWSTFDQRDANVAELDAALAAATGAPSAFHDRAARLALLAPIESLVASLRLAKTQDRWDIIDGRTVLSEVVPALWTSEDGACDTIDSWLATHPTP